MELWAAYLSKEPAPEERVSAQVAQLSAQYSNAHRGRGKKASSVSDHILFSDAWRYVPKSSGNKDVDEDIKTLLHAFAPRLVIANPA